MKKFVLTGSVIFMFIFTNTALAAFPDVTNETPYKTAIDWLTVNEIIDGYPDGTYKPNQCVNRAEFLKLLFLTDENEWHMADYSYSDVDPNEWYAPYVSYYSARGVVDGYPDGTFKPGNCVNRVEAVKMAILEFNDGQIPNYEEGLWSFPDIDRSAWYGQYIVPALFNNLVGREHMTGVNIEGANFYPGEAMTRKEVAELLYRLKTVKDNDLTVYQDTYTPNSVMN